MNKLPMEHRYFEKLFESSPEGIVICDEKNRILQANQKFCEMFGYQCDEIIGRLVDDVVAKDPELRAEAEQITKITLSGKNISNETIRQRKDGTRFPVSVLGAPIYDGKKVIGVVGIYRDITELKKSQEKLLESLRKNQALLNAIPDMIFVISRDGTYLDFKADREDLLAISPEKLIGKNIRDAGFDRNHLKQLFKGIEKALDTNKVQTVEYSLKTPAGLGYFEARIVALNEKEVLMLVRDITEQKKNQLRLERFAFFHRTLTEMVNEILQMELDKNPYQRLVEHAVEVVPGAEAGSLLVKDETGVYRLSAAVGYNLKKLKKIFFGPKELAQGNTDNVLIVSDLVSINQNLDPERLEILKKYGRIDEIKTMLSIPVKINGEPVAYFCLDSFSSSNAFDEDSIEMAKIFSQQVAVLLKRIKLEEELRRQKKQLKFLSEHDPLTDLPNRRLFAERVKQYIALAKRRKSPLSILYLDLNHFKEVNDTFGHDVGDLVLRKITKRFKSCLRESDLVARLGGDEFVFALPDTDAENAAKVAKRIIEAIEKPINIKGKSVKISGSIGVAVFPDDGENIDQLLKHADMNMYRDKRLKCNNGEETNMEILENSNDRN
ncbi:MAG: hypothetical protein PWQ27_991 [Kosmotoga sp.]|nr:hypothetical protein [Kosmotoga sp.]